MTFDKHQLHIIRAALLLAAEDYIEYSEVARKAGEERLEKQFVKQAADATAIAEEIQE